MCRTIILPVVLFFVGVERNLSRMFGTREVKWQKAQGRWMMSSIIYTSRQMLLVSDH
jgi:hypothetical protein